MVDLRIDIRTKEMLNITPCKVNPGGPDKQPKHQAPTTSIDNSLSQYHHRATDPPACN